MRQDLEQPYRRLLVFADKHIVEIAGIVVCLQCTFSVSLLL